jgi:hypothetical protein
LFLNPRSSAHSALSAPKRLLSGINQKLPLPLRERGGVRGIEKNQIHIIITPTHSPPSRGRKIYQIEPPILFKVYGALKGMDNCGEICR